MSAPSPAPRAARRRRPSTADRERGVALIIVVVAIAVLTVVGTEFAYNTTVDLQLAANQRDEVRAYYLARSGIAMSRLLLRFQRQVDQMPIPNPGSMLGGGGGGGMPGGQAPGSNVNLQLWKLARVDCHMLRGLVGGAEELASAPPSLEEEERLAAEGREGEVQRRSFGGFEGCFLATMQSEEDKLNVLRLNAGAGDALPTALRMMDMMGDKRFEFVFEREDANGVRVTPQEVLLSIRDWADEDQVQSALNLADPVNPLTNGFADEGGPYTKYEPRYQPKNARYDSLDELYRVHGVSDRFMAAFRDRLTVYPDLNARPNINTDDPMMLYLAILSVADPTRPDPRLQNPAFVQEIIERIRAARAFSFFGMSVTDFVGLVQASGVPVNAAITSNPAANRLIGDKSNTFTIKSVGEAGAVQKTLTAVVRLDDGLGRILYWREE